MKLKSILPLALVFFMGISLQAQEKRMNKFKSLKIAYITETLELTSGEAEKFWPIYNLHSDNIHKLRVSVNKKLRNDLRDPEKLETLTDKEAENTLNMLLNQDAEMQKEKTLMFEKLRSVLPAKKLLKLHKAENDFSRKILEQYRKRKEQGPSPK